MGVDSSESAITNAKINMQLNENLISKNSTFIVSDCIDYMQKSIENGMEFDVIILDPPKLAPHAKTLEQATKK